MEGTGVPIVTPFTTEGEVDEAKLRGLVSEMEAAGIDFIVPCGSNGESELMTGREREEVVGIVADEANVPVLAGTGHPGMKETKAQTAKASQAGADAALVITPYYYSQDQPSLKAYYTQLADFAEIPLYLYNSPGKTGVAVDPETAAELSNHKNIHGMKDSSGDIVSFSRTSLKAKEDFRLLIGNGSLYAHGLFSGGSGGILALANVAPHLSVEIYQRHQDGDIAGARDLNLDLIELNEAITTKYGIPGLKYGMKAREMAAGVPRSPLAPIRPETKREIHRLVSSAIE